MQSHPAQFISILEQRVNTHGRHTMPMNGANLGVSSFSAITVRADQSPGRWRSIEMEGSREMSTPAKTYVESGTQSFLDKI